jgi:hypothetical protein
MARSLHRAGQGCAQRHDRATQSDQAGQGRAWQGAQGGDRVRFAPKPGRAKQGA